MRAEPSGTAVIEYRPKTAVGLIFAGIFAVTAVILLYVGFILGPADREAMDVFTRLLFTLVPIRLFSWTFAAVFLALGIQVTRRTLRSEPTLLISEAGVTLPTGKVVPWEQVRSVEVARKDQLLLEIAPERAVTRPLRGPSWLRRLMSSSPEGQVQVSSFALGADPVAVAAELEGRRAEASPDVSEA